MSQVLWRKNSKQKIASSPVKRGDGLLSNTRKKQGPLPSQGEDAGREKLGRAQGDLGNPRRPVYRIE